MLSYPVLAKVQEKFANEYVRVGTCSMQGRRSNMEDEHTVRLSLEPCHPSKALFGVFDGHCGKEAARYCTKHLHERLANSKTSLNDEDLISIVHGLDRDFMKTEFKDQGSTLVFAIVDFGSEKGEDGKASESYSATIVNVGDSRVLWGTLREGISPSWKKCTEDHKPKNNTETERIREGGGLVFANRVDGCLGVSRAIGDYVFKNNPDLTAEEQKVIATPDIKRIDIHSDDWLIVACDGIFENLKSSEVANRVSYGMKESGCPVEVARDLCDYAVAENHSGDNTTVVAVYFKNGLEWMNERQSEQKWFIDGKVYDGSQSFATAYSQFAKDNGFPEKAVEYKPTSEYIEFDDSD